MPKQPNDTSLRYVFDTPHLCKFTEAEYAKPIDLNAVKGDVLEVGKLTNRIHPLFDKQLRLAVPDFSVVEQSARLASHFLDCGVLDRIFLAISNDGKRGRSWQKKTDTKKKGLEIPPEELTGIRPDDRDKARDLLTHLSTFVSYELDPEINDNAVTTAIVSKKYVEERFPDVERSYITIARKLYDHLKRAQQNPEDTPYLLNQQFNFAITLVHEIGHVVDNHAHGKLSHAHFLGENVISEVGFDVENRLFGGHLTTLLGNLGKNGAYFRYRYKPDQLSRLRGFLVVWEYPYQIVSAAYRTCKSIETRQEPKAVRPLDVAWRVPITSLGQLFQDKFWNEEVRATSNWIALRPRCSVGYTFRQEQNGPPIPVEKHKNDAKLFVPKGYHRIEGDGSIVRDDPENGEFVDTTKFWDDRARGYSSSPSSRPWKVIRKGADFDKTQKLCDMYYVDDADDADADETDAHETDAHATDAHETDAHETDAHETDAHETDAHETDSSLTDVEDADSDIVMSG